MRYGTRDTRAAKVNAAAAIAKIPSMKWVKLGIMAASASAGNVTKAANASCFQSSCGRDSKGGNPCAASMYASAISEGTWTKIRAKISLAASSAGQRSEERRV